MSYHFTKNLRTSFDDAIRKTVHELKKEGFGILTEIDVQETLKKKLDVDLRRYKILGRGNDNPSLAKIAEQVGARLKKVIDNL